MTEHYDRIGRETQARLEEKQIAAVAAAKDLQALRDEAARGSDAGHTGRPVPPKLLKQLVDKERELDVLLDEKRLVGTSCAAFTFLSLFVFLRAAFVGPLQPRCSVILLCWLCDATSLAVQPQVAAGVQEAGTRHQEAGRGVQ